MTRVGVGVLNNRPCLLHWACTHTPLRPRTPCRSPLSLITSILPQNTQTPPLFSLHSPWFTLQGPRTDTQRCRNRSPGEMPYSLHAGGLPCPRRFPAPPPASQSSSALVFQSPANDAHSTTTRRHRCLCGSHELQRDGCNRRCHHHQQFLPASTDKASDRQAPESEPAVLT